MRERVRSRDLDRLSVLGHPTKELDEEKRMALALAREPDLEIG